VVIGTGDNRYSTKPSYLIATDQESTITFPLPDPGPPNTEFERPADQARLEQTAAALGVRGFQAQIAENGQDARKRALSLLPNGAEVHTALSETLQQLGVSAEIEDSGRYDSIRAQLKAFDRETQFREMRKLGAAPDYILGSAHAITDDGRIIVGSGSGSQLGAYAYAAGTVILVVGQQKLVTDVNEGLRRVCEYSLPREYTRMQEAGMAGSLLAKTLILEFEPSGRIHVILVPENLGF
jgi:hypothetical protein